MWYLCLNCRTVTSLGGVLRVLGEVTNLDITFPFPGKDAVKMQKNTSSFCSESERASSPSFLTRGETEIRDHLPSIKTPKRVFIFKNLLSLKKFEKRTTHMLVSIYPKKT